MRLHQLKEILIESQVLRISFLDKFNEIQELHLKARDLNNVSISDYEIQVMYLSEHDKLIHIILNDPALKIKN